MRHARSLDRAGARRPAAGAVLGFLLTASLLAGTAGTTESAPAVAAKPAVKSGVKPVPSARRPASRRLAPKATTVEPTAPQPDPAARAGDEDMSLKGGQSGTVFRSLTVEGEDRVHIDFERPALAVDLDPQKAPGLVWGGARDVLSRTGPDLGAPLKGISAKAPSPYLARPWLEEFASGPVARFSPAVDGVERWRLLIANSRGETVTTLTGTGRPPQTLSWDGRDRNGKPVTPGLTYSYAFEAYDRAGNKRNFVGEGFTVSAYRLDSPEGPTLLFAGRQLGIEGARGPRDNAAPTSLVVLEAASWLNQSPRANAPLRIAATARSFEEANRLSDTVARQLGPLLLGDPARLRTEAHVQPDAPEGGTITIAAAH